LKDPMKFPDRAQRLMDMLKKPATENAGEVAILERDFAGVAKYDVEPLC